ncbi:hypothetical protein UlMin_013309 [Ulmus minor]
MDYSKPKRSFGDLQSLSNSKPGFPQASQSTKLQEQLKLQKPSLSYADLHHEITKDVKSVPEFAGDHQKQRMNEDELIKYMSNLPSYLQRGETLQEKALSVGVLDWGRLEKWKYSSKQMPYKSSRCSPSSSNTSSTFSTDGSSTYSSRGHSCSPSRQRTNRPSLQSHLMASPMAGQSQVVNSSKENIGKFQDVEKAPCNTLNGSEKFISEDLALCKNPDVEVEQCKKNNTNLKRDSGSGTLQNDLNNGISSCTTVKTKTPNVECTNIEKMQKTNFRNTSQDVPKEVKTIVLLLPKGLPERNNSGESQESNLTARCGRRPEACQRSLSEGCKKAGHDELSSDIPLPSEVSRKQSQSNQLSSMDKGVADINLSCGSSPVASHSAKMGMNPSKDRKLEARESMAIPTYTAPIEPSKYLDKKPKKVMAEKVRSTSPFSRFTIGIGKVNKNGPVKSNVATATASAGLDASSGDKLNANGKVRSSSPLRRLLDPLLKPKPENGRHSVEQMERGSISTDRACKSSDGRHVSSTVKSGKVKLDMTGCKTINVNDSAKDKKHGPTTVQALFRISVKNGLPLFTFAVENQSNILAASVKKLNTTVKDDCSCIYTFFSIQNGKKKNGTWINQGSKGKGHDYISNVVAQMRVSDTGVSNLSKKNESSVQEFVLFSVDARQEDHQTGDFRPNDELAAVVVKIPKKNSSNSTKDRQENGKNEDTSHGCHSKSVDDVQCRSFSRSGDLFSTTVILPSAVHSIPSNGGPSSLIERWKSGGVCDCGGWDLGCKLRILGNQNQVHLKLSSSKGRPITDRLVLFPQGGGQEHQPVFGFSPFKEGIYSVEFNSSLSTLQAFSICTAVLESRKICVPLGPSNSFEEKSYDEPVSVQNAGISGHSRIEEEVPRYISYPPLSPVGRV